MPTRNQVTAALLTICALALLGANIILGQRHTPAGELLTIAGAFAAVYLVLRIETWAVATHPWGRKAPDILVAFLLLGLVVGEAARGHWVLLGCALVLFALFLSPESVKKRVLDALSPEGGVS